MGKSPHFYVAHPAAAAHLAAAAREFDARREELAGQGLRRAGMQLELHWRPRANRAMASTLASGVPRGTSQPAPQMYAAPACR